MRNGKKRVLAFVIALMLMIGMMPVMASADSFDGVTWNQLSYTGNAQALVSVPATGTFEYSQDGTNYSATIPTETDVGEYTVWVKSETAVKSDTARINSGAITVTSTKQYNYSDSTALKVNGTESEDTVQYSTDNGTSWSETCPTFTENKTGSTLSNLAVKVTHNGSQVFYQNNITATITQNTTLQIKYSDTNITNHSVIAVDNVSGAKTLTAVSAFDSLGLPADLTIGYNWKPIKTIKNDDGTTTGITGPTLSTDGEANFAGTTPGLYEIWAYAAETNNAGNYSEEAKTLSVFVAVYAKDSDANKLVSFSATEQSYILGTTAGNQNVEGLKANAAYNSIEAAPIIQDDGAISYSIAAIADKTPTALQNVVTMDIADSKTNGNYSIDSSAVNYIGDVASGSSLAEYTVTATKPAKSYNYGDFTPKNALTAVTVGEQKVYDEATATYTLQLNQSSLTGDQIKAAYTVTATVPAPDPGTGWYQSVTVQPNTGYKLANSTDKTFTEGQMTFNTEGTHTIYIQNATQGIVTGQIYLENDNKTVQIDTTAPSDLTVQYSKVSAVSYVTEVISLGFIKSTDMRVAIHANDLNGNETGRSGVSAIKIWAPKVTSDKEVTLTNGDTSYNLSEHTTEAKAITINNPDATGTEFKTTTVVVSGASGTDATYLLSVAAVDRAGNENSTPEVTVYTKNKTGEGTIPSNVTVIEDTTIPTITIGNITPEDKDGQTVTEAATDPLSYVYKTNTDNDTTRYNQEVCTLAVPFEVSDDNLEDSETTVTVTRKTIENPSGETVENCVTWDASGYGEKGTINLSGDGIYTVKITAADEAGNTATYEHIYVVDSTAPDVTVTIPDGLTKDDDTYYTNADLTYTLTVKDINFDGSNVTISGVPEPVSAVSWSNPTDKEGKVTNPYIWNATYTVTAPDKSKTTCNFKITVSDGIKVNNETKIKGITTETSAPEVVINTKAPQINIVYDTNNESGYYNNEPTDGVIRTMTITMTGESKLWSYSTAADIDSAKVINATDIKGNKISNPTDIEIVKNNVYDSTTGIYTTVFKVKFEKEGNYSVDIISAGLKDRSGNSAVLDEASKSYQQSFVLDHTAPNAPSGTEGTVQLSYNIKEANKGAAESTIGKWWEKVTGTLFGYWKTTVEVTVTAEDSVAGLNTTGSYTFTPESGTEISKEFTLQQDENKKNTFTGTIKLPNDAYNSDTQQLNGSLQVDVQDLCGNTATKNDQNYTVVYDTLNPQITVSHVANDGSAIQTKNDVYYFSAPIKTTLKVQETNFDNGAILTLKNNGTAVSNLTWTLQDGWNTSEYTVSDDGEYVLTISGQDYAGNKFTGTGFDDGNYTSSKMVVDRTPPVLSVSGLQIPPVQTIDNAEYYMSTEGLDFKFSITEQNFDPSLILITVTKNGQSATKDTDYTVSYAKDNTNPVYNYVIHFSNEGEYTVAISGTDLANNKLVGADGTTVTDGQYTYAKTIVLDNTAPEISLTYAPADGAKIGQTKDGKQYISGDVVFTMTLKENFLNMNGLKLTGTLDGTTAEKTVTFTPADTRGTQTTYTYTWTESAEKEYKYVVTYTDYVNRDVTDTHNYTVTSTPEKIPVIDKTTPVIAVTYADGLAQQYYNLNDLKSAANENGHRLATVTITEKNLDTAVTNDSLILGDLLQATNSYGADAKTPNAVVITNSSVNPTTAYSNKVYTWNLDFAAEANYVFDMLKKDDAKTVIIKDLAGNEAVLSSNYEKVFTVDRTAPRAVYEATELAGPGTVAATYNIGKDTEGKDKWYTTLWTAVRFGYWKESIEVTLDCYDETAGLNPNEAFTYTFTKASTLPNGANTLYVSDINHATFTGTAKFRQEAGTTHFTAKISLPKDALGDGAQLDGTFEIQIKDYCRNESNYNGLVGDYNSNGVETRLVYDTISPTCEVSYGPVVSTNGYKTYFSGPISGKIYVNEANLVVKNGGTDQISVTGVRKLEWSSDNADQHVATFSITGEGMHVVTISGADYSGNALEKWDSGVLVIDESIEAPEITVNGEAANGKAFKDAVNLSISFFDENYSGMAFRIEQTKLGEKGIDVTDKFKNTIDEDETGGFISFDSIAETEENDGIYTVTATVSDYAGHSATSTATFTINRFGSVYSYDDYLASIIKDGGSYLQQVKQDLKIKEYNADKLVGDVKITITRDGKPLKEVKYTSDALSMKTEPGESGWYEYEHIISKDNFKEDGLYKISITSEDAAGNHPENTNQKGMSIQFVVDSTPPELTSVTGLEKAIVNAESQDVSFDAFDAIGLKSVTVYLDSQKIEDTTDFGEDSNNYSSGLTLEESPQARHIRIVLVDLAGNVLDTDAEGFTSSYKMVHRITVSTNFWVRFYANKPLFYGCIIGLIVLVIGGATGYRIFVIARKKGKHSNKS